MTAQIQPEMILCRVTSNNLQQSRTRQSSSSGWNEQACLYYGFPNLWPYSWASCLHWAETGRDRNPDVGAPGRRLTLCNLLAGRIYFRLHRLLPHCQIKNKNPNSRPTNVPAGYFLLLFLILITFLLSSVLSSCSSVKFYLYLYVTSLCS